MPSSDLIRRWGWYRRFPYGVHGAGLLTLAADGPDAAPRLDVLFVAGCSRSQDRRGYAPYRKEATGASDGRLPHARRGVFRPRSRPGVPLGGERGPRPALTVGTFAALVGLYGVTTLQAWVLPRQCGVGLVVGVPMTKASGELGSALFGLRCLALGYVP